MAESSKELRRDAPELDDAASGFAVRGPVRVFYLMLGGVFFVLAVLGALLPVLPTTPFLLLTSYFWVRSSPALHNKLLASRTFGPLLRDWRRHRAVRPRVKRVTLVVMPAAVLASAYFGNLGPVAMAVLLAAGLVGFIVIVRLRVISE